MQTYHLKPRGFGEVLDGAFQIYRSHFVTLGLTTLLPSGLSAVTTIGLVGGMSALDASPAMAVLFIPVWIAVVVLTVLTWGSLAWQTSEAWIGGTVGFADGMRAGMRSFWRLLGACIVCYMLFFVGYFVIAMPLALVAGILGAMFGAGGGGQAAGAMVGVVMVVLFVPAFLVGITAMAGLLSFTLPAVVVEGLGPLRAVSRAIDVAKGGVLRSGALIMVAWLIVALGMLGVMFLTGGFTNMFDPEAQVSMTLLFLQQMGMLAIGAFTTPFVAAVITVAYYDRRVRNEALDVQMAAAQLGSAEPAPF